MNYVLDIIIIGIVALFIVLGVRRGFVKSAVSFVGSIVAVVLSAVMGEWVATWIFDSFFRASLIQNVDASITGYGGADAVGRVIESLPDFLVRTLANAGVTKESLESTAALQQEKVSIMVVDALSPVLIGLLKVLAAIVLFMIFMMLVRVLANLLSTVVSVPILSQLNGLLGGVFGLLRGAVLVWIVLAVIQVFTPMLKPDMLVTWQEMLDKSLISGFFVNFNPLSAMFK